MNIDERIEKLTESQEKTQVMLARIVDTIGRLERIVLSNTISIDDLEARLTELENRPKRKPQ